MTTITETNAIAEILPNIQALSREDKLLLLQVVVQELLLAEGIVQAQTFDSHLLKAASRLEEEDDDDLTIEERLEILRKPPAERGRILAAQAESMKPYYEQNTEWKDWPVDDIIEHSDEA